MNAIIFCSQRCWCLSQSSVDSADAVSEVQHTWMCLVQVGNGIELEAVGLQFEPYRWRPCGVTWDSSWTVVVIKLRRTPALEADGLTPVLVIKLNAVEARAKELIFKQMHRYKFSASSCFLYWLILTKSFACASKEEGRKHCFGLIHLRLFHR